MLPKKGSRTASGLWSRGLLNDQGTIKKVNQTQFGIIQNCQRSLILKNQYLTSREIFLEAQYFEAALVLTSQDLQNNFH